MEDFDFSCSEKLTNLLAAYNAFQAKGLISIKTGTNAFFKSSAHPNGSPHSKLPDVLELIRPALVENDLALLQMPRGGIEAASLIVRLSHVSGEFIQWIFTAPLTKRDPQGVAACITYLRRISLTAVLGLPETDDDGNHASNGGNLPDKSKESLNSGTFIPNKPTPQPPSAREQGRQTGLAKQGAKRYPISEAQLKRLFAINKKTFSEQELNDYIFSRWQLSSLKDLVKNEYDTLIDLIQSGSLALDDENFIPSEGRLPYDDAPPLSEIPL